MKRERRELLNLDVLALSLLCCLLAAVVGVLVLGEDAKVRAERIHAGRQVDHLASSVSHVRTSMGDISSRLLRVNLESELRVQSSEADELRRKIEARERIKAIIAEIALLEKHVATFPPAPVAPDPTGPTAIFGDYHGAYVLIECMKDKIIVSPGNQTLRLHPSADQLSKLALQIERAGFGLFIVRPSGWFGNTFDDYKPAIEKALEQRRKPNGKRIPLVAIPLGKDVPINTVLTPPKG